MNNFDDIIKKSFEDQSLENESWLEPSDSVLGVIHAEIKEDKEEKKFSWYWPFGVLLLIVIGAGLVNIFSQDKEEIFSQANSELIKLPTDSNSPNTTNANILSSTEKESSNTRSAPQASLAEEFSVIDVKDIETEDAIIKLEADLDRLNNKNSTEESSFKKNNNKSNLKTSSSSKIDILSTLNIKSNINQSGPFVNIENKSSDDKLNNENLGDDNIDKSELSNLKDFTQLSYLENIKLGFIASDNKMQELQVNEKLPYIAIKPLKKEKETVVEFSTGFLNWNDQLNTNYQAALSPADFENGNDFGFQVGLAVKKEIISKLSAGFRVSYSQIENTSGHNAVLSYDETQEVNRENNYESIQLATPYGFVNSNFNIKRSEAAPEPNAILNSSINSKHQIRIASLETLLNFNLLTLKKLSLNLEASLGYNHLIALNNDLDFIETNHDHFEFTTGEISVDQGNLRDGFWSTGLNVNLNYDLKPNTSIGFNYGYREALSPLFSSGDFSSTPSTQQFNFSIQRKF